MNVTWTLRGEDTLKTFPELKSSTMIDEHGWTQKDPISDEECILICLRSNPLWNRQKTSRSFDQNFHELVLFFKGY